MATLFMRFLNTPFFLQLPRMCGLLRIWQIVVFLWPGGRGCLPLCNFGGGELGEHVFQPKNASLMKSEN